MLAGLSSRDWNDAILRLRTRYPLKIQVSDSAEPSHAWKVSPAYDGARKKWTASLIAGSVNCRIATIAMPFSRAPIDFQTYLRQRNPEKQYNVEERVSVPLDFRPSVDLVFREIGGSASPISQSETGGNVSFQYEPIPRFFLNQGVRKPGQDGPVPPGTRRLFASDLVLRQPRSYLLNDISIFPGGPLGGSVLSVNAIPATPPDVLDPARVVSQPRFVVPATSNSFSDIFFQRFVDEPVDDLHLSTVYAISQPLGEGSSFPEWIDESFQLMTRYYCHYNLAHATRALPRFQTPPLTLVTGLAAGLGDVLFNFILSFQNDFTQSVIDLFNQRSLRGSFWAV